MLVGAAHYHDACCTAEGLSTDDALRLHDEDPGFVWLSFVDPSSEELRDLQDRFGLHEVAGEDILARHDRPKFEAYDDDVYLVVLRTAVYDPEARKARFGELAVFLGETFVLSTRKGGPHAQGSARASLHTRPDLLGKGVSAVLWVILAKVVSDLRPVVEQLDDDLMDLEEDVFSEDGGDDITRRIFDLRHQLSQLYRAIHPMLGPLDAIEHGAYRRLEPMRPHLREVCDEARVLHEDIVAQRDRLTALLEASLALLAHRQNDAVRKVSAWVAILAAPTLIAGVFGMNFNSIPGSDDRFGFLLCLGLMLTVAVGLYVGLRRARWM
jgi:magnesium transporter